jgi:hypothetical protein
MPVLDYYSGGGAPMPPFGGQSPLAVRPLDQATVERVVERRLNRILAFCRLTIHDVVNNPIARNQVLGYYKLSKMIDRRTEIVELERQWNPMGAAPSS